VGFLSPIVVSGRDTPGRGHLGVGLDGRPWLRSRSSHVRKFFLWVLDQVACFEDLPCVWPRDSAISRVFFPSRNRIVQLANHTTQRAHTRDLSTKKREKHNKPSQASKQAGNRQQLFPPAHPREALELARTSLREVPRCYFSLGA
jgi:hypothetical protein